MSELYPAFSHPEPAGSDEFLDRFESGTPLFGLMLSVVVAGAVGMTLFVLPILMEHIRPNDVAAVFVYFGFGCIAAGGHLLGIAGGLIGFSRFFLRYIASVMVAVVCMVVMQAGHLVVGNRTEATDFVFYIPGVILSLQLPFVMFQMIGNWRIDFGTTHREDTNGRSIADLMLFTAIVAVSFSSLKAGYTFSGQDNSTPLAPNAAFVGITVALSLLSSFIFVRPYFRYATNLSAVIHSIVATFVLMVLILVGIVIARQFMGTVNRWETVGLFLILVGFTSTTVSGLLAIRLMGGQLMTGAPQNPDI